MPQKISENFLYFFLFIVTLHYCAFTFLMTFSPSSIEHKLQIDDLNSMFSVNNIESWLPRIKLTAGKINTDFSYPVRIKTIINEIETTELHRYQEQDPFSTKLSEI